MTYNGGGVFHCDECPEHIETDENEFAAARLVLQSKGWRSFIGPDKQWAHACPACVSKFAEARRHDNR